jgi:ketosteroid isomerase-like protein
MTESPITSWFDAVSRFDVESALSLFAPDARLLSPDGRRAEGVDEIRDVLGDMTDQLRAFSYEVTAEWHQGDTWIAELQSTYELSDYAEIGPLPRAVIARMSGGRIADLRLYGANERLIADRPTGEEGIRVGGRWIPPL